MTAPSPSGAAQPFADPARVVVVVPRKETGLHDYLRRSLGPLKNVEVVLDRRAVTTMRSDERRRRPSANTERKILMCSLVRCPAEPPRPAGAEVPPDRPDTGHPRTLHWPALRLDNL
jgi:hypothetical protein